MIIEKLTTEFLEYKDGVELLLHSDDLRDFSVVLTGPEDSLYSGEKFKVKFFIPEDYPFEPPKVRF